MRKLTSTKDMPTEEWRQIRKMSLGGSDAAVVLGLNKYKSPYTLWAEKNNYIEDICDNEAMRIGRDLEQYVADRFCEVSGKKVRRRNFMFMHDNYDYITANIDREIVGENAGLECKTTNAFAKSDFENGEIPLYYYCQCMHYMAVMGYEKMYLAVLVLGRAFYWFEIERSEDEIDALINTEKEWWQRYIVGGERPEPDDSESTSRTIGSMYKGDDDSGCAVLYGKEDILDAYIAASEKSKELTKLAGKYKNMILDLMQNHTSAVFKDYDVTAKTQHSKRIDSKKIKTEYPDVYKNCVKDKESKVLRYKLREA